MTKHSEKTHTKQSCKTGVIASDNLMVTVSGGRSSAFMAYHILHDEKYKHYNKVFVFCNTRMERPETIDLLRYDFNFVPPQIRSFNIGVNVSG